MPVRVPPFALGSPENLGKYIHEKVFPRVSLHHRKYLAQFFTVLFTDGQIGSIMETLGDFSAWDSTTGTPTVSVAQKHHGVNSCQLNANNEYCTKLLGAVYTPVYARCYVYFESFPWATDYEMDIMRFGKDSFWFWGVRVIAKSVDNGASAILKLRDDSTASEQDGSALALATWYCIGLKASQTGGVNSESYLGGVLDRAIGPNGIADSFDRFDIGGANALDACEYIDCIVVADAGPIPCEGALPPRGSIASACKIAGII